MLKTRAGCARYQVQQTLEVSIGADRQIGRLNNVDLATRIGAIRLQQRRRTRDLHSLVDVPKLELHVHTGAGVDVNNNVGPSFFFEAGLFYGYRICAGSCIRENIISTAVGLSGTAHARIDLSCRYLSICHYGASAIGNCAKYRGAHGLAITELGCEQQSTHHSYPFEAVHELAANPF
jgi:hypothetical protein